MKLKWKRAVSGLVVLVMALSLLAGCGSAGGSKDSDMAAVLSSSEQTPASTDENMVGNMYKTGLPIVKEKVTLKIAAPKRTDVKNFEDLPFFKMVEEKTNVHIDWILADRDNGWEEKKSLMFASQDLPDAMYDPMLKDAEILNYGSQGLLIPLSDYIDKYGENIKNLFASKPDFKSGVTTPDGKIYSLPLFDEGSVAFLGVPFINTKWLKQLNLSVPTNTDEFYNVLKAFKENDMNGNGKKDEIPFGFCGLYSTTGIDSMFGAFGNIDNWNHIAVRDGKLVFTATQPEFKAAVQYYHKLFSEGLIDKESISQSREVYLSKLRSKDEVYGFFPAWTISWAFGAPNSDYEAMQPLKAPDGKQYWNWNAPTYEKSGFVITNACKNPEIAFRWADYQYDTLIALQAYNGTIGDILKQNTDGTLEFIPLPSGKDPEEARSASCPGASCLQALTLDSRKILKPSESDMEKLNLDKMFEPFKANEGTLNASYLFITQEEADRLSIIETDIKAYVEEMEAKWLLNGGIENEWDGYVKKLQDMKLDEMMKINSESFSRSNTAK